MADQILTDDQIQFFSDNGYIIIRNVLAEDEVAPMREALQRVADGEKDKLRFSVDFKRPDKTVMTQLTNVHKSDPVFLKLIHHPVISQMAAELMNTPEVRLWHDQVLYKRPGDGGGVSWHQDWSYWQPADPADMITSWTAFDPANEKNGCMNVVPGSHKWGLLKSSIIDAFSPDYDRFLKKAVPEEYLEKLEERVPYIMNVGDVGFHHCLTLHGSYANKTPRHRRGFVCHYLPQHSRYNAAKDFSKGVQFEIDVPDGAPFESDNFPLLYKADSAS